MHTIEDTKRLRGTIARSFPIENIVRNYWTKTTTTPTTPLELHRRLRVCLYLTDKAQAILVSEIDLRGSESVLEGITTIESVRSQCNDLLESLSMTVD